ncbi:hypothetical protein D3C86_2085900 [compost metagenome]
MRDVRRDDLDDKGSFDFVEQRSVKTLHDQVGCDGDTYGTQQFLGLYLGQRCSTADGVAER